MTELHRVSSAMMPFHLVAELPFFSVTETFGSHVVTEFVSATTSMPSFAFVPASTAASFVQLVPSSDQEIFCLGEGLIRNRHRTDNYQKSSKGYF